MPYRLVKEDVDPVLDDGELVESSAKAVGCTLVLTDRRLLVVRERASQRPRFGIVGWPLDQELVIRLTPAYHATRQLVLSRLGRRVSVFVTTDNMPGVKSLLAAARRRIYGEAP